MTATPCPQSESAYDFLSGRMTEAERSAFEEHLDQCAACREEVEALRETVGHLDTWSPPEVSPGFAGKIMAQIGEPRPGLADRLREWLRVRPLPLTVGAVVAAGLVVAIIGFFPQILSDSALRREKRAVTTAGPPSPKPSVAPRDVVPRPRTRPAGEKVKPSPAAGLVRGGRVTRAPRPLGIGSRPAHRAPASGEGVPAPPAKQPALKKVMPYRVHKTPPPRTTMSTLGRRKKRYYRRPAVRPSPEPKRRAVSKAIPPPRAPERSVRPRTGAPDRPDRAGPARQKPPPPSPATSTRVARRSRPRAAEVRQGGQPRGRTVPRAPADRLAAVPQNLAMVLSLVQRYHGRVIKPTRRTAAGIVLKVVIPIPQRKVFLIRLSGLKRHGIRRVDKSLTPINILVTIPPTRTR